MKPAVILAAVLALAAVALPAPPAAAGEVTTREAREAFAKAKLLVAAGKVLSTARIRAALEGRRFDAREISEKNCSFTLAFGETRAVVNPVYCPGVGGKISMFWDARRNRFCMSQNGNSFTCKAHIARVGDYLVIVSSGDGNTDLVMRPR